MKLAVGSNIAHTQYRIFKREAVNMRKPNSMRGLETLGRIRLSKHVYFRDCLYSEIANYYGMPNIPDDPDLAIEAGKALCVNLIDPLVDTFGGCSIRSAYRSRSVNDFGSKNSLGCSRNDWNGGHHIWDKLDKDGNMGATATVVVPWFADQYEKGRDWQDMAWWIHDHLPYASLYFFPKLCAFNLQWSQNPIRKISSYIAPKGTLLRAGDQPTEPLTMRQHRYSDFPVLRLGSD